MKFYNVEAFDRTNSRVLSLLLDSASFNVKLKYRIRSRKKEKETLERHRRFREQKLRLPGNIQCKEWPFFEQEKNLSTCFVTRGRFGKIFAIDVAIFDGLTIRQIQAGRTAWRKKKGKRKKTNDESAARGRCMTISRRRASCTRL